MENRKQTKIEERKKSYQDCGINSCVFVFVFYECTGVGPVPDRFR